MVSSFLCVGARRPGFLLRRNYTARHPRASATQQDAPAAHSPASRSTAYYLPSFTRLHSSSTSLHIAPLPSSLPITHPNPPRPQHTTLGLSFIQPMCPPLTPNTSSSRLHLLQIGCLTPDPYLYVQPNKAEAASPYPSLPLRYPTLDNWVTRHRLAPHRDPVLDSDPGQTPPRSHSTCIRCRYSTACN